MQQSYFLGGVTAGGFRTRFSEQIQQPGFYTYILKGGPGTGKSTLMKRVAAAFDGEPISLYHCSSDESSLDAVVLEDRGVVIVDGTAPHVFEAKYPLVSQELVNLGACLDKKKMQDAGEEVRQAADENAQWHQRARQYVQAVTALHQDLTALGNHALLHQKLTGFGERLAKRTLPKARGAAGSISYRQLSALTASGYVTQPLPPDYQITELLDPLYTASDTLLRKLAAQACKRGLHVIASENILFPEPMLEAVLLPELKLVFSARTPIRQEETPNAVHMHMTRFYHKELLAQRKQRITFDRKAALALAEEASSAIANALTVHDRLESHYIDALDFDQVSRIAEDLIAQIRARS